MILSLRCSVGGMLLSRFLGSDETMTVARPTPSRIESRCWPVRGAWTETFSGRYFRRDLILCCNLVAYSRSPAGKRQCDLPSALAGARKNMLTASHAGDETRWRTNSEGETLAKCWTAQTTEGGGGNEERKSENRSKKERLGGRNERLLRCSEPARVLARCPGLATRFLIAKWSKKKNKAWNSHQSPERLQEKKKNKKKIRVIVTLITPSIPQLVRSPPLFEILPIA